MQPRRRARDLYWSVVIALVALTGTALVTLPASAAERVETIDTVNATGERFELFVDGTPYDVAPEELRASAGTLQFCDTCNLGFGHHTFTVRLKGTTDVVAELDTRDQDAPIEASDDVDYALAFHRDDDSASGYALSLYRDDVTPLAGDTTRVEVRNLTGGTDLTYEIVPNGENGGVERDVREGTLGHTQWIRHGEVVVNDYELRVWAAGDDRVKEQLVACQPDLELEGAASVVVYVGGQAVPASQLSDRDVKDEGTLARVCRELSDRESAFQRSSFDDGVELRAYAGPQLTRGRSVAKVTGATDARTTGPAGPYATTVTTDPASIDRRPDVTLTAPADGATVAGSIDLTADATDDEAVTRVEFRVDGTVVATDTSAPFAATFDTTTIADGRRSVTAVAFDSADQRASSSVEVLVDNDPLVFTQCPTLVLSEEQVGDQVRYDVATDAEAEFTPVTPGASVSPAVGTATTVTFSLPDSLKPSAIDLSTGDRSTEVAVDAHATATSDTATCTVPLTVEVVDFATVRADVATLSSAKTADRVGDAVDRAERFHARGQVEQADRSLEKAQNVLERDASKGRITPAERVDVATTISFLRDNL